MLDYGVSVNITLTWMGNSKSKTLKGGSQHLRFGHVEGDYDELL